MTRPPQNELFVSDRPVHSDYEQERAYARRRITTVIVLLAALGGGGYAIWGGGGAPDPANIPTIKAEGAYKQKPSEPGGIDIPHQDVRVYDQLESKNGAAPQVEHLLPPPEIPKEIPHAAAPAPTSEAATAPAPAPAPVAAVDAASPKAGILPSEPAAKPVSTTIAPVAAPPAAQGPTAPQAQASAAESGAKPPLSIEQIIKNTETKTPASAASVASPAAVAAPTPKTAPKALSATGKAAIQLASLQDEAQARAMMEKLQRKYAAQLGSAKLRLVRADLGSRGIYYRIQSQNLLEGGANRICSSLKQLNARCILVGK